MTHQKLMEWDLYESPDDLENISKYNRYVSSLTKNKKYVDKKTYKLNNIYVSDNKLSIAKLNYINKRIGVNLNYNDILRLKIVLNLKDILKANNITKLTRHPNIIDELDVSFIGFISKDNSFINMRNLREGKVHKSINSRYVNYNIFNKFENTERFYTIPTNIELDRPDNIKFHLAEGVLDILSIYYNLRNQEDHSIYAAMMGGNYINSIYHFITTLALPNMEFHIYPDKDVYTGSQYNKILNELRNVKYSFQVRIYIHTNLYDNEKDFGVPKDRIKEYIVEI
ncbi:MAG: hypothetical protein ACRCXT_12940 [Paraclostridium sp.]